ncbi:MAG: OmpA family protein [Gammaproteobacteria bacterium]|nr:OmpA family protein [Gammaproteobacteria bacterium]
MLGHTDDVPIATENHDEFADNQALSYARAKAVAEYIESRLDAGRIHVVGAADRYPLASNETAAGRRQNRRVELLLRGAGAPRQILVDEQLEGESTARIAFSSAGSPEGKSDLNKVPLAQLQGGFDSVEADVAVTATGSWDVGEKKQTRVAERDPNVQGLMNSSGGDRLSRSISSVKLDLDTRLKPRLLVDGEEIPRDRIGFKMEDVETGKTLYSYIGVDFAEPGSHTIRLEGVDSFGNVRYEEEVEVVRVGELRRHSSSQYRGQCG